MARSLEHDAVLFSKGKFNKNNASTKNKNNEMDQVWKELLELTHTITMLSNVIELVEGQIIEPKPPTQAIFNHVDNEDEWIIDSNCSHHVIGNDSLFSELHPHNGEWVIVTANNSTYPVAKKGVVEISSNNMKPVKLNDVLHVPGLKRNLVSISQITSSEKHILFGPNDVEIIGNLDSIVADIVLTGEKRGSLFVMTTGESYVKKTSQIDKATIWHAWLGHLGYQSMHQISLKKLVEEIPSLQNIRENVICQGCQFGKSHCLTF
ncbi:UNVERIFIED_CONTAM: hypothetical protein Scaly_0601800 [Sesamum calycinum]|uniref:GAG-pre-integrase domain-containing protein n=1 Tax=Sesamum calycinum TaxID=2727403 RepID=A0AAW2RTA4_9LAMI